MQFNPHLPIINRDTDGPLMVEGKLATLGFIVVRALDAKYQGEENQPPSAQFDRYKLASRIKKAQPDEKVALSIDEAKLIKDAVPKMFAPGIFGQVWEHLEEIASAPRPNSHAEQPSA